MPALKVSGFVLGANLIVYRRGLAQIRGRHFASATHSLGK